MNHQSNVSVYSANTSLAPIEREREIQTDRQTERQRQRQRQRQERETETEARQFLFFSMFARESSKRVFNVSFSTGGLGQNLEAQTQPPAAESEPWIIRL